MTKRFLQALHFQQSFITTFFFFSFLASCSVAIPQLISAGTSHFLIHYPLTSFLITYNFLSFIYVSSSIKYLPYSKYYPVVLYGQTLLYLGVAYEYQDQGAAFLSILPALAGIITLSKLWTIGDKLGEHRYQTYLYILALTYGWFQVSSSSFIGPVKDSSGHYFLSIFFGQILAMTLFPSLIDTVGQKITFTQVFKKMMKEKDRFVDFEKQDRKDRFFFHDMINHLYGLVLKFTYRLSKGKGIEAKEVADILNEVMALQALLIDHFGYKHKNATSQYESISFNGLKPFISNQIDSFLAENCQVNLIYADILDENRASPFDEPQIPFAPFYRILTNLLKNSREANCKNVEIIFSGDFERLTVSMKNDFAHAPYDYSEVGESLSKVLKHDREMKVDYQGLGLAAIETLCSEYGGHFHFEIRDGYWVSHFSLKYTSAIATKEGHEQWLAAQNRQEILDLNRKAS